MAVTRADIVAAGLGLLGDAGLPGLTLRRLAERLEIRAPTLYWHVRDKRELIELLAEAVADEVAGALPSTADSWQDWLRVAAIELRRGLSARRDGAIVVSANPQAVRRLAADPLALERLVRLGLDEQRATVALRVVTAYVLGVVLADDDAGATGEVPEGLEPLLRGLHHGSSSVGSSTQERRALTPLGAPSTA